MGSSHSGSQRSEQTSDTNAVRPLGPEAGAGLRWIDLLLICAICLALYLAGNGQVSLWDRDEPRYAQAAREMLQRSDLVVPTFNNQPRFHKPILIYWLTAAAYQVFGETELAARLFSGLAGTVACLLTYRLGTRMGGRRVGLAAGLMLAVSPLMLIESKLATPDAVLLATLLGALSCLWELHTQGFTWSRSIGFWALIGVAILTKGPVGPGLVAMAMLVWLLLSRQAEVLWRMNWAVGIAVLAVVVLPWGLAVYRATGGAFYLEAIGKHVVARSLSPMENHRGFPGYYLATTLAGMFPWSLALPMALGDVRRWARTSGPGSFLLGWAVGPMILLELVQTKLPHYYLPAYPALAILIAHGAIRFHDSGARLIAVRRGRLRVLILATVAGSAALALGVGAATVAPSRLLYPLLMTGGLLGVGTALAVGMFFRLRDRAGWWALVGTWGTLGLLVGAWVLPRAETCRLPRRAAERLRACAAEHTPIVLYRYRPPSLVFYLGSPVPTLTSVEQLIRQACSDALVFTLLSEADLSRLGQCQGLHIEVHDRIERPRIGPIAATSVTVARLSCLDDHTAVE